MMSLGKAMTGCKIEGCRAIVTGASSGIGRALVVELVQRGAKVVAVARREDRLESLGESLRPASGQLVSVVGDVTEVGVRERALAMAIEQWGGLDALINNAGVGAMGHFGDASEARLRRVMEVNFFAATELTRAVLPALRANRGMIVNVSSVLGHRGVPNCSEYCASKFAMQGWSESLRAEVWREGIGVLVVSPGTTDTEFSANVLERQATAKWAGRPRSSAESVARRTVRAMERGRNEIIPSASGWLLCMANRVSPRLMDWAIGRWA
jgi:short-subunit dehydrogenase